MTEYFDKYDIKDWLPTTAKEVKRRDWDFLDVILFTGDAYIDHPSFGSAVIGRVLENMGLRVAIVPQPNWQDDLRDFKKLGQPRLFFGVTSGSMDSMVNHYTAGKRRRSDDAYTPGNKSGQRPDNATVVYSNILKDLFPDVPVVIGGIEASLRRFSHYDYWSDSLRRGILVDSKADLLIYGMAERAVQTLVQLLQKGVPFKSINNIQQTGYLLNAGNKRSSIKDSINLFSHEECIADKSKFAQNFRKIEEESNKIDQQAIEQQAGNEVIIINPPFPPANDKELDSIYALPYTRLPHPRYKNKGRIPAYEMIRHSVTIHRGCFGGCSFCTISAHQGKFISSRSEESILMEIDNICKMPDFKGYISDIGGPSANMYKMNGIDQKVCNSCNRASCIFPGICNNLNTDHKPLTELYKTIRAHKGVKKAFIGSGIRHDMFINELNKKSNRDYLSELVLHHISGRLKVAPEHTSDKVLKLMRKPSFEAFIKLNKEFKQICKRENLNQQLIPYFISSHPGCETTDMAELAIQTKNLQFRLEQVQDFTPTPMTLATVMYYTGINPYTRKKIFIPRTKTQKVSQNLFFFWYKREKQQAIIKELEHAGRRDLIKTLFSGRHK